MTDATFYSTAAQVLPLFALTLLVERRYGPAPDADDAASAAFLGILLIFATVVGEFAAFAGITGDASRSVRTTTEGALGLTGVTLAVDLIRAQLAAHREHSTGGKWERRSVTIAAGFVVGVFVLTFALLYLGAYLT